MQIGSLSWQAGVYLNIFDADLIENGANPVDEICRIIPGSQLPGVTEQRQIGVGIVQG